MAALVASRSEDGWFAPRELMDMFEALRIPRPGVGQALTRLAHDGLVVRRRSGGLWSLTPEGRHAIREQLGALDVDAIEAELVQLGGAELSSTPQPLILPELAPVRWAAPIGALLARFPFETNVFCMTRFPADQDVEFPDPVENVIATARDVLARHGLALHLASDRNADDELFGNIAAHIWACKYGLGLFETRFGNTFNDNLQIEVGAMLMTGRRVALLKDIDTPEMPTNLVGHIYKPADFEDSGAVAAALHNWASEDLFLGRCESCPNQA